MVESLTAMGLPLRKLDASAEFFRALEGVADPEAKRRAIGHMFIETFERAITEFGREGAPIDFLVQGTLYPDIVESGAGGAVLKKKAANIKTHHNVGGLPDSMRLKPAGTAASAFQGRGPPGGPGTGRAPGPGGTSAFSRARPGGADPGPGERGVGAERLRRADLIVRQELDPLPLEGQGRRPWQYFAVLLPVQTVGVMGDQRTYAEVAAVRAVYSLGLPLPPRSPASIGTSLSASRPASSTKWQGSTGLSTISPPSPRGLSNGSDRARIQRGRATGAAEAGAAEIISEADLKLRLTEAQKENRPCASSSASILRPLTSIWVSPWCCASCASFRTWVIRSCCSSATSRPGSGTRRAVPRLEEF